MERWSFGLERTCKRERDGDSKHNEQQRGATGGGEALVATSLWVRYFLGCPMNVLYIKRLMREK